jgi:Ca-activated chloride channel family protein
MLAEDLAPNRLARAKLAAFDLLRMAKSDRMGLVAFAGTAFLQCPLTLDDEAFRQSVEALQVGIIPQGGSALTEAIETAAKAFGREGDNHKVLILLTDGEDHDGGAVEAAQKAAPDGLRIFTIGVGTPNGELLRQRDESGALTTIKNAEGNAVISRLNEALLTQIATAAHGFYLPMSGANTMQVLYDKGLAPLPKSELSSKLIKRYHERYQWFLGLAIALLVLEMFLPERKRILRPEPPPAPGAELRRVAAALLLCLLPLSASASSAQAHRKYQAGQYKEAEQAYQKLLEKKPDDPRLHYNAGAAAYQAGDFAEAAKHFSAAPPSPDLDLQQRAYYNLGNSLFRLGESIPDPAQKSQAWEQSVKQYEGALKLDPADADAKFNQEFVKKKLEELKQQQQQQQQKNSDDQKEEPKDKNEQQDKPQQQSKDKDSQPQQQSKKPEEKPQDQPKQTPEDQKEQGRNQKEKDEQNASKEENKSSAASGDKADEKSAEAAAEAKGQITPEQVKRLLDAAKNEEKAMIFIPKGAGEKRTNRDRIFKDW